MSYDLICGLLDLDHSRGPAATSGYDPNRPGHRRHHRGQGQGQGRYQGQGQGRYQGPATGTVRPDPQKLRVLRDAYRRIKDGHINWLTNQDHQNNVWGTPAATYLQASRLWARQQLRQQQLPVRSDPSTSTQWQQPIEWFRTQAQAAINASSGQMASQITTTQPTAGTPYAPPTTQSYPTQYPTQPSSTTDAYYPAPGDGQSEDYYEESGEGKSPERKKLEEEAGRGNIKAILALKRIREDEAMAMRGDGFTSDEARAAGEDGSSGSSVGEAGGLSHGEYRALIMRQAIKGAGGKRPTTKHVFEAKDKVDRALGGAGVAVQIPGAMPGRRTI